MPLLRNDPKLLASFRNGERAALEQVYRAYVRPIDRYVRLLVHQSLNRELAQTNAVADLLQEIFIRAFSTTARNAYDGVRDYGPYLKKIARNCVIDTLRRRDPSVTYLEDAVVPIEELSWEPQSPRDPRVLAILSEYLLGLSVDLTALYQQRFVLGRSQAEASAALGMTRAQLRTAEQRLTKGLRKSLAGAGLSPHGSRPREGGYFNTVTSMKIGKEHG